MIVAIDGPAGAGKTSTARAVADTLGFCYLDTGAMYRAITLAVVRTGKPLSEENIEEILEHVSLDVTYEAGKMIVFLDGYDVTEVLRTKVVSSNVSAVSAFNRVRTRLVEMQRQFALDRVAEGFGVVIDGRDIGTVVFPDADIKVFMDASPEIRAKRRFEELQHKGEAVTYEEILQNVVSRDEQDSQRKIAPLRKAEDAQLIDTSVLPFEDQVQQVIAKIKERQS